MTGPSELSYAFNNIQSEFAYIGTIHFDHKNKIHTLKQLFFIMFYLVALVVDYHIAAGFPR